MFISKNPQLAIFTSAVATKQNVHIDICLEDNILVGATVSIYINFIFSYSLGADPYGNIQYRNHPYSYPDNQSINSWRRVIM